MFTGRAQPRSLLVLAVGALIAAACNTRDVDSVGTAETPVVLLLSSAHAADETSRQRLGEFLTEQAGFHVAVEAANTPEAAITKVGAVQADAALLPLFGYLFCRQEYGVEAQLQVVRDADGRSYVGEILVRAGQGLESLADLEGKRIAFVDAYSTTGFLLPAARLRRERITVDYVFAGSHDEALTRLRSGDVDAAATYRGAAAGDPGLRAIAVTDEVPNEPIFFRSDLEPERRERLAAALVAYAQTDEGREVLGAMANIVGFAPIDDEHYQPVHEVLAAAGQSVEDLVPRGWLIRNENRLTPVDYAP